ncbi:DNA-deoxyinosine glycosylase [Novosphingobium sp.]|uniref:DNA-deoxyinosine glycosylase n=1 Tax=Novosphingobium sp. TaxID=1874826 RepID=UPI003D0FC7E0
MSDQAFDPVADSNCRVLILGSFPGIKSLQHRQYYANPRNQFWHLVSGIVGTDLPSLAYPDRLKSLVAHGIGLWDVVATANRAGSLDAALRNIVPRDLQTLAASLPNLRAMAFNGATAFKIGQRQMAGNHVIERLLLPSSSPAHTIDLTVKAEQWQKLAACLEP